MGEYQPEKTIATPAPFDWPLRPLAALRWLLFDMLFPWGYLYIAMAFVGAYYLTPPLETMREFAFGWIALIWLRNAAMLTVVAGGLHWWLYMRRSQGKQYEYDNRPFATNNKKFLWGDQVRDNMFWSLVSGVTIWTAYESITWWVYANGWVPMLSIEEHGAYVLLGIWGVFFWGLLHFFIAHRLMHWPPLYKISHEMHHRNINVGPWTGISMHPVEHLLYFSAFALLWFVPVHPVHIVLLAIFMGVGPVPSHAGFNFLEIKGVRLPTGDWFHQLHHQYFNLNYGNSTLPMDKLIGSWHNGSEDSLAEQKERMRARLKAAKAQG